MRWSLELTVPLWRTFDADERVFVCFWISLRTSLRYPVLLALPRVTGFDLVRLGYGLWR